MAKAPTRTAAPLVAVSVAFGCLASPAAAQRFPEDRRSESAAGYVRGSQLTVQVLPASGEKRLPSMVLVEIDNLTGGHSRIQWVQGDGTARFDDVAGGSYTFRVRSDDYQDSEQTLFVPPASRGRSTVSLTLGPKRASTEPKPDAAAKVVPYQALNVPPAAARELQKAAAESAKRRSERAVAHARKALEIHPGYFEALALLGTELVRLRRLPEATDAYQRALDVRPDDASTSYNLGLVALELKDYAPARRELMRAAALDTRNASAYFYLGECYLHTGDVTNAIRAYLQATQREPNHLDALLRLGLSYERAGQPAPAGSFYRRFLQREPAGPRAEQVRARLATLATASTAPH